MNDMPFFYFWARPAGACVHVSCARPRAPARGPPRPTRTRHAHGRTRCAQLHEPTSQQPQAHSSQHSNKFAIQGLTMNTIRIRSLTFVRRPPRRHARYGTTTQQGTLRLQCMYGYTVHATSLAGSAAQGLTRRYSPLVRARNRRYTPRSRRGRRSGPRA